MRRIEVHARARGRPAAEVYEILCALERYPECASAVRSLTILESGGDRIVSRWEVEFHGGVLQWTEEARLLREKFVIQFRQLEGDADYYAGEWGVRDEDEGCSLWFSAEFDFGLPSLDETIGPIAEMELRKSVRSILIGLLGDSTEIL
jgi:ribosome-associated toxin RatA of RatAB toxin-antitoxin module